MCGSMPREVVNVLVIGENTEKGLFTYRRIKKRFHVLRLMDLKR